MNYDYEGETVMEDVISPHKLTQKRTENDSLKVKVKIPCQVEVELY